MSTVVVIILGILVLAAAVVSAGWETCRRRRANLPQRFGSEYSRKVQARGSERDAEQHLSEVADRRDRLDIRQLEPAARDRYNQRWEVVRPTCVRIVAIAVCGISRT
jgi:FtsZ-interacting cell division protein ZipA